MPKELIISANAHEKKVAIIEDGVVTEFYVERVNENTGVVGNIYKGRVMKVLPGMQSAFVDIGLERDAFLYVSDFLDLEDESIELKEVEPAEPPSRETRHGGRDRDSRPPAPAAIAEDERPAPAEREPQLVSIRDEEEESAAAGEEAEGEDGARRRRRRRRRRRGDDQAPGVDEYDAPAEKPQVLDSFGEDDAAHLRVESAYDHIDEVTFSNGSGRYPEPASYEPLDSSLERVSDDDAPTRERAKPTMAEIIEVAASAWFDDPEASIPRDEPVLIPIRDEEAEAAASKGRGRKPAAAKSRSRKAKGDDESEGEPKKTRARKAKPDEGAEPKARKTRSRKAAATSDASEGDVADDESSNEPDTQENYPIETVAFEPVVDLSEDDEAEVGDAPARFEMATRRGGRNRRRRPSSDKDGSGEGGDENGDGKGEPAALEAVVEEPVAQAEPPREREAAPAERDSGRRDRRPPSRSGRRPRGGSEDAVAQPAAGNAPAAARSGRRGEPLISDLLHEGQEIIVQIAKEPIAKKGARITSHVVLPGRFLVYMPTVARVGVSRKVASESERVRLKRLVAQLREREPGPGGFIARTAAVGQSEEDLLDDMRYLQRTWAEIKTQADRRKAPSPLHRDLDLVQRILRDQISDDFSAIRVDNELEFARIVDFVNRVQPRLVRRVKLHTRDESIFETYGVQAEIDKAIKTRVWLKSGGYIVINQTEALVAIDVNTGKFVGKSDRLEDTITRTNMEAVKEIVRQVRLRDLGGIIVIDFIDMEERRNRMKVAAALEQELRADRSPSKVLGFNDFGLIIITRKRVKQSLERTLCSPCPYCQGAGLVKSTQTMAFEILSEARRLSKQYGVEADDITLRVGPDVAQALRSTERSILEEIEAHFSSPVRLKVDHELHQEQFDFAIL